MAFDDDDLELAFQLHVVDLVIEADLVTSEDEAAFVARFFAPSLLAERGFVDAHGARTPKFDDAAVEALRVLPTARTHAEKVDLLEAIFRIAVVDRTFRLGEGGIVLMAARLLGLTDAEFDAFLQAHPESEGMTASMLDADIDD